MKITEIFSSQLPVGETLSIKRSRFEPTKQNENAVAFRIVKSE